jgi:hypothetical protein
VRSFVELTLPALGLLVAEVAAELKSSSYDVIDASAHAIGVSAYAIVFFLIFMMP